MAQIHEGYKVKAGPPPSSGDESKMASSRQQTSSLEPNTKRPVSRHSSVGSVDGRSQPEVAGYSRPQKPIGEAVTNAFDQAHINGYSKELIAQITQNVIQELNKTTSEGKSKFQPQPPTTTTATTQLPHSPPSTQSGASPPPVARNVYTPPSPQKYGEYPTNFGSPESKTSMVQDGPKSPSQERPTSQLSSHSGDPNISKPRAASRPSTADETTLERIWGTLFDVEGHPTKRLGQFLRGMAEHMIASFEPKDSIVVTPEKMEQFFKDMQLDNEVYPWELVFDDEQSNISRMYRELGCQHHLVQDPDYLDERPWIPGLTPFGFQQWATMLIQAHPEFEFQRLQKAACAFPVNNPDDKKERFPKELSRRLLPSTPDLKIRGQLVHAIEQHCHVTIESSSASSETSRQTTQRASSPHRSEASVTSDPPYGTSNIERERNPYSTVPTEGGIDDLSQPKSQPIERERKPYRAAPGQGRVYEGDAPTTAESQPPPRSRIPPESRSGIPPPPSGPPPAGPPPLQRAASIAQTQSRPINIPPAPAATARHQEYVPESYHAGMAHRASVSGKSRRGPSPGSDWGRRSEPDTRSTGFGYDEYSDDDRHYNQRSSPPRRIERSDTIDPRDTRAKRRSMYEPGEEYYRTRANTVGGRNW